MTTLYTCNLSLYAYNNAYYMQGICGVASTMLLDVSPESGQQHGLLTAVMASSRLLLTLINNMLDLEKIESAAMTKFELTPVRLETLLNDAADFCRPFAYINEARTYLKFF
jgi:signal transduction histidine kinase